MIRDRDNGQGAKSEGNSGWPTGPDDDSKRARPEDRDDYIENRPFRGGQRQGPPDPSRASNAERYSHHKRPLE